MSGQGCDGDGYTEYLDDDMTLVVTLCPGCADCDPCIAEEEEAEAGAGEGR